MEYFKKFEENLNNDIKCEDNLFNIDYDIIKNGDSNIMALKNFEIVDDNFYKDFIERKNIIYKNKIIETEVIINNGKIILFSENNKIILIGHIINNNYLYNKFITDIFLNSSEYKNTKVLSAALKRMNYINAINNEILNKNVFIHYFDESLRPKISNETKEKMMIISEIL